MATSKEIDCGIDRILTVKAGMGTSVKLVLERLDRGPVEIEVEADFAPDVCSAILDVAEHIAIAEEACKMESCARS